MRVTFHHQPQQLPNNTFDCSTATAAAFPLQEFMSALNCNVSQMSSMMQAVPAAVDVSTPTNNDVLLGRGVATNRHPGNENYRAIVSLHVVSHTI